MDKEKIKRVITTIIGMPILAIIFIYANNYIIDIFTAIIALISMYEYFHCFKISKKANPSKFLGYFWCMLIGFRGFVDSQIFMKIMITIIPISLLVLFTEQIVTKDKKTFKDIGVTMFGICYIPLMLVFLSIINTMNLGNNLTGKILIWFVIISSWGSDTFAYLIGKNYGKHKLTPISPKKTIEGSIAGIVSAVVLGLLYSFICNTLWAVGINYLLIGIIVTILCIIGQIGDLAASSIKRYCEIKDFSNLIPGHGGMLDRIDSIIFVLPFAYILLSLL